jgi:hypothetical protein
MKKKESKWGMVIQYLDNDEFKSLSKVQTDEFLRLRSLKGYVDSLNESIDSDMKKLKKLQKEIKERKEKIKSHKMEGKPIYERLEHLKNQREIVVYYTEGFRTKEKIEDGQNGSTRVIKNMVKVKYPQINLKYRSVHISNTKTVNLKPTRGQILDELKLVCPDWYQRVGEGLRNSKHKKIEEVKGEFVNLFSPILRELITENSKKINDKEFSITFKLMLEKLKDKGL